MPLYKRGVRVSDGNGVGAKISAPVSVGESKQASQSKPVQCRFRISGLIPILTFLGVSALGVRLGCEASVCWVCRVGACACLALAFAKKDPMLICVRAMPMLPSFSKVRFLNVTAGCIILEAVEVKMQVMLW